MITQADNTLPTYQSFGEKLHINFNEQQITINTLEGSEKTSYQYTTAVSLCAANRDKLISDIINSKYSTGAEFAVINNKDEKPEAYAEYQSFRTVAKQLADGWLVQVKQYI